MKSLAHLEEVYLRESTGRLERRRRQHGKQFEILLETLFTARRFNLQVPDLQARCYYASAQHVLLCHILYRRKSGWYEQGANYAYREYALRTEAPSFTTPVPGLRPVPTIGRRPLLGFVNRLVQKIKRLRPPMPRI